MDEVFEFRWRFVMRDESIACLRTLYVCIYWVLLPRYMDVVPRQIRMSAI